MTENKDQEIERPFVTVHIDVMRRKQDEIDKVTKERDSLKDRLTAVQRTASELRKELSGYKMENQNLHEHIAKIVDQKDELADLRAVCESLMGALEKILMVIGEPKPMCAAQDVAVYRIAVEAIATFKKSISPAEGKE